MSNLRSRLSKEKRFQIYGLSSILIALFLLSLLFASIISQGYTAFQETRIQLTVNFDQEIIDPNNTKDWNIIRKSNFNLIVKNSISKIFPEVSGRDNKRKLYKIISNSAEYQLRDIVKKDISIIGVKKDIWVLADDDIDMLIKGNINRDLPENERRVDNQELKWIEILESKKLIEKFFNKTLFTSGDSAESEQSGILGALLGSLFALTIT